MVEQSHEASQACRKTFEFRGKVFELDVLGINDSTEITRLLTNELTLALKFRPFKGRYVDLTPFKNISLHIDWISFMESK